MEEGQKVKVHGMWASGFSKRVEVALKIKGVSFEYVEENLPKKSEALLRYNPVHKKVPVLVHNGKATAESLVILEYIDETWSTNLPRLFPTDPYERAKVRFWAKYIDEQVFKNLVIAMRKEGEEQKEGKKELAKNLKVLEEGIEEFYSGSELAFDGKSPIFLSLALIGILGTFQTFEKIAGEKIIDQEKNPFLFSLLTGLVELPEIKECMPPLDKFETLMLLYKKLALQPAKPHNV